MVIGRVKNEAIKFSLDEFAKKKSKEIFYISVESALEINEWDNSELIICANPYSKANPSNYIEDVERLVLKSKVVDILYLNTYQQHGGDYYQYLKDELKLKLSQKCNVFSVDIPFIKAESVENMRGLKIPIVREESLLNLIMGENVISYEYIACGKVKKKIALSLKRILWHKKESNKVINVFKKIFERCVLKVFMIPAISTCYILDDES